MEQYKRSRFTIDVPVFHEGRELAAVYNTLSGAFLLFSPKDWTALINSRGNGCASDPATMNHLSEQGVFVSSETDETLVYENWWLRHVYGRSTIKSRVIATRKCNMACKYCLIEKEALDMSSETARKVDDFYLEIIREARPLAVSDEAGGAETMLNVGVLIESSTRRFYFCQGLGIPYSLSMVTNGTLVDRHTIERLKNVGLKTIRVSLAGPARLHNTLRPFKGGGGTYETIMRNLASISGLVPITIECQYDSSRPDHESIIPEMFDDFGRYGIAIAKVRFCPILPARTSSSFPSGPGNPEIYLRLTAEARKRGYSGFDTPPSNRCAANFRNYWVFDVNGEIIPCPGLQAGELTYGDVHKGIDFAAESRLLMRKLPNKCFRDCALLPLCMGGCRQQALTIQGDFNGIDCRYDSLRLFLESYITEQAEKNLAWQGDEAAS